MSSTGGTTLYERVGGTPYFTALVAHFYQAVESDPVLRPLYPDDLEGPKQRLTGFLIQYWGGPADYSAQRGHPRLRMRHMPFAIGSSERDAWYRLMADAVRQVGGASPEDEEQLLGYFQHTTGFLVNHP
ncbi:MAG TPA: globin [Acidimicrobiales bacterium]|jgi:hemoglobin|nr:globin [Acidimicrobiales bacterium]